jgi:peptide-methionine (S)-S-oxide reductase
MKIILSALAASAALAVGLYASGVQVSTPAEAAAAVSIPAPAADIKEAGGQAVAVFAGGCFWGVEGVFEHVAGVKKVEAGYAGGGGGDANYDAVSGGRTKHAEAVRIVYDPAKVSYGKLLHIFFSVAHDPTQLNRQGPDRGPQYRSAIFPQSAQQRQAATAYIDQLGRSGRFRPEARDEAGAGPVLRGRGLSPGLHAPEPAPRLYRRARRAQAAGAAHDLPAALLGQALGLTPGPQADGHGQSEHRGRDEEGRAL